jgi:uncharacterized protein (TIGR00369 family)
LVRWLKKWEFNFWNLVRNALLQLCRLTATQPLGVLHGGAHVVLAESLGSFAANVWAHPEKIAVGIEVNASHSRSATSGVVTAVCTALSLGKSLTTHEIVISDEEGRRLSTVRITNFLKEKKS